MNSVEEGVYSPIAFNESSFLASTRPFTALCACCIICVGGPRLTITQSHTHTMQQTHMYKAVVVLVEAKELLSHRRQSINRDGRRVKESYRTICHQEQGLVFCSHTWIAGDLRTSYVAGLYNLNVQDHLCECTYSLATYQGREMKI